MSDVPRVPWTYLVVETVERRWVTARIVSALRTPLGTIGRRRMETIAVRVRPALKTTRVQIVLQGQPGQPLAGCDVAAAAKVFAEDEPASAPQRLMTDRDGRLTLARHDQSPLVWLSIKSGEALLARVPFCPGIESEAVLELPDDSLRLKVEGDLSLLDARLIDTVARRATLLARMRLLAREGDWDAVAARRNELEKLPDTAAFDAQLAAIRIPALEQARAAGNRVAEARIRKLCGQTSDLIRRYLDKDKLRVVLEEIEELRRLDRDEDRAGAP